MTAKLKVYENTETGEVTTTFNDVVDMFEERDTSKEEKIRQQEREKVEGELREQLAQSHSLSLEKNRLAKEMNELIQQDIWDLEGMLDNETVKDFEQAIRDLISEKKEAIASGLKAAAEATKEKK